MGLLHRLGSGCAWLAVAAWLSACRTPPPPPVPWFEGEASTQAVRLPQGSEGSLDVFVADVMLRSPEGGGDRFGSAMAMGNRTLAIAAATASGRGAVWIFDTTTDETLLQPPTRLGPGADAEVMSFGASVSVSPSGRYVAVGAPDTTVDGLPSAGAVMVWRREDESSGWKFVGRFLDPAPHESARLGTAVAINDRTLLAGAPGVTVEDAHCTGTVLVWTQTPSKAWRPDGRLRLEAAQSSKAQPASSKESAAAQMPTGLPRRKGPQFRGDARFGQTLALNANEALVGAPNASSLAGAVTGATALFVRVVGKWREDPRAVLVGRGTGPLDEFGAALGLYVDERMMQSMPRPEEHSPSMLAIGAPGAVVPGMSNAGCVHLYRQDPKLRNWAEMTRLQAPTPESNAGFGASVSISRDRLVVGAPAATVAGAESAGDAIVFELRMDATSGKPVWRSSAELRGREPATSGHFGDRVAATDDCIAVTEPGSGLVHLFRRTAQGPGVPVLPAGGDGDRSQGDSRPADAEKAPPAAEPGSSL